MKKIFFTAFFTTTVLLSSAQPDRWQQRINYKMDISLDVVTNKISGKQTITYTNNSSDTLYKLFMHLYWNAFQPNSMFDVKSRIAENTVVGNSVTGTAQTDFDRRNKKKIYEMTEAEQGYTHVTKCLINGKTQQLKEHETILEVILSKPILPKTSVTFTTEYESQVPKLSRRAGRDNAEGVRYSMGQWYPKVCEYDNEGWHPDDYISREFYGVWGDFTVNITLDKNYKVGASGVLQNSNEIGWGYDKEGTPLKNIAADKRTWKFIANNVHDFAWTADPDYKHITRKVNNNLLLHFIYKDKPGDEAKWQATADTCVLMYDFMAKTFGPYPYPVYSFLQGGSGGTEYPMATIVKDYNLETAIHEWCHSWYQMMMGTNENLYAWMDEGFASYADERVAAFIRGKDFSKILPGYTQYFRMVNGKLNEPMSTHANFFNTNYACNTTAYSSGAVFLTQLGYIVGEKNLDKILLEYYRQWRFKHPNDNDFVRIAEKVSGMQLQWYKQFFVYTTKTIDYGIDSLWEENGLSKIRLKKIGQMPMPLDVQVTFADGTTEMHYIPVSLMFGEKANESNIEKRTTHPAWRWAIPQYTFECKRSLRDVKKVEIDPSKRMADTDRKNNIIELNW